MGTSGYIYALVNNSMPGLVKVGCTTRNPNGRAAELSGATGVATPFVVAYYAFFPDMQTVERQVHINLEARGLRVASNREFFKAELSEVIKCIIATPGHDQSNSALSEPKQQTAGELADNLHKKALSHLSGGDDDVLEDEEEGLRLLTQAAQLGHTKAMLDLGDHYRIEYMIDHREADAKKSLDWFKEAAQRGDVIAFGRMAVFYRDTGAFSNEQKCWSKFLQGLASPNVVEGWSEPGQALADYLRTFPTKKSLF